MRLRIEANGRLRTVAVVVDDASARVADLAAALGLDGPLLIDGVAVHPDALLQDTDLVNGSVLTTGAGAAATPRASDVSLVCVAGPEAGREVELPEWAAISIGRAPDNRLAVGNDTASAHHAIVHRRGDGFAVEDRGSRNGTWIDGRAIRGEERIGPLEPFELGSSTFEIRPHDVSDRPAGLGPRHRDADGRILINRPPRRPLPPEPTPIPVPVRPEHRERPPFPLIAVAVPLVLASVLVVALGSWRFGLFALLSPVMLVANHLGGRRVERRDRALRREVHDEALGRLERELTAAQRAARRRHAAIAPDPAEIRRRIELPSTRLWEKRADDDDAMTFALGRGGLAWDPPLDVAPGAELDETVVECLDRHRLIDRTPVLVDLRCGPVGLVGDLGSRTAAARSAILQLATHHGPADLAMAVLTRPDRLVEWEWAQWLPHAVASDGVIRLLAGEAAESFAAELRHRCAGDAAGGDSTRWLIVVDDVRLVHGRSSPLRWLLARSDLGIGAIVLGDVEDQLPASTVLIAGCEDPSGAFSCRRPASEEPPTVGLIDGLTTTTALEMAAAMARYDDPDLEGAAGELPNEVGVPEVLGGAIDSVEEILRRWAAPTVGSLIAPLGVSASGPFRIDLVADGPHALVAGTTGSGKSELLRTLIAGLASNHGPDRLVFVLVDYKGGAAFDPVADLPHVVGLVTDLDDHLAERALQSLEAELLQREARLREVGAVDIAHHERLDPAGGPLPHLVVIIDEFATLRAELPDFVDSLVGIAQRGRSLGVHLVLATQRPSGAVDANIRANTDLRMALRVQDAADSLDVVDVKDAAEIARSTPGRAVIRRGSRDLVTVQIARLSGAGSGSAGPPVRVAPVSVGDGSAPRFPRPPGELDGTTDLDVLVATIQAAADGLAEPRRPWLSDLPGRLGVEEIEGLETGDEAPLVLAVGDDPTHQRRVSLGWDPRLGHMVAFGALGAGVTTLLRSAVAGLGRGIDGREVWVYVCDHGAGGLEGIDSYGHVGGRLDETDGERHRRLLGMLASLIEDRRRGATDPDASPLVVVVVDGFPGFLDVCRAGTGQPESERLDRILRDGPAVGVVVLAAARHPHDMPRSLLSSARVQFVFELSDPDEYATLGIRARTRPRFRPGRVLVGHQPMVGQVIDWSETIAPDAVAASDGPPEVEALAADVERLTLPRARFAPGPVIPVGLDDGHRGPAEIAVRPGEHLLVAGPSGSGRTTTLATIARQLRAADPALVLVGLAPTEDADLFAVDVFDATGTPDSLDRVLSAAASDPRPWAILIDDAERIGGVESKLETLAVGSRPDLLLVAAVRSTAIRQLFGHWTRHVRASGVGILLMPDTGVDGELLGVRLPRGDRLPPVPGRGYLVQRGEARVVQIAH